MYTKQKPMMLEERNALYPRDCEVSKHQQECALLVFHISHTLCYFDLELQLWLTSKSSCFSPSCCSRICEHLQLQEVEKHWLRGHFVRLQLTAAISKQARRFFFFKNIPAEQKLCQCPVLKTQCCCREAAAKPREESGLKVRDSLPGPGCVHWPLLSLLEQTNAGFAWQQSTKPPLILGPLKNRLETDPSGADNIWLTGLSLTQRWTLPALDWTEAWPAATWTFPPTSTLETKEKSASQEIEILPRFISKIKFRIWTRPISCRILLFSDVYNTHLKHSLCGFGVLECDALSHEKTYWLLAVCLFVMQNPSRLN